MLGEPPTVHGGKMKNVVVGVEDSKETMIDSNECLLEGMAKI